MPPSAYSRILSSAKKLDSIFKHGQAIATLALLARPPGMVGGIDVALGMRHQTKDAAGFITQAGDIELRAIGIGGIRNGSYACSGLSTGY
jgi:hypothetical protein